MNELIWWLLGRGSEAAAIITLLLGVPGFYLQWRRLGRIEKQNKEGADAVAKLAEIRRISDGKDESIWSRPLQLGGLAYHKAMDRSIPIILVGNLKGGVGKTTIAGNLGAHFATKGERVLLIDMDYQGTLSALLVGHARIADRPTLDLEHAKAEQLLSGEQDGAWLRGARAVNNQDLSLLHFIAADAGLADLENRMLIRWLLGEASGDIRLNLAKALLSPEVQSHFDRVIIDTAPRLTLAFVAAACTSTHILIPTMFNEGASRSVKDTLQQTEFLRRRIAGHLQLIGIAGSKTYRGAEENWTARETASLDNLKNDIHALYKRSDLVLEGCKIRESARITDAAGWRLAYFDDPSVEADFAALGDEIAKRAPLRRKK